MRVLLTGAQGFIGSNLAVRLGARPDTEVLRYAHGEPPDILRKLVALADRIVHLAGVNRPKDEAEFDRGNGELTATLCTLVRESGRRIPLILPSSTQAARDNPYGRSKRAAEQAAEALAATGNPVVLYRLPGVFGKWCRPDYNSVVATFCHNLARDLPISISDPANVIRLVHVDDVIEAFLADLDAPPATGLRRAEVAPEYAISLGALSDQIHAFRNCRDNLVVERVGSGLTRALYSTYVSYLPPEKFVYDLPGYADERGVFVEMLKTLDSGQFSYFTSRPGVTRGGHYHHGKTEKFLVIKGEAQFRFRHIVTGERHEIFTSGERPQVVETVPGWTHDVTNTGSEEMVVMLWANTNFDRSRPDTIPDKV